MTTDPLWETLSRLDVILGILGAIISFGGWLVHKIRQHTLKRQQYAKSQSARKPQSSNRNSKTNKGSKGQANNARGRSQPSGQAKTSSTTTGEWDRSFQAIVKFFDLGTTYEHVRKPLQFGGILAAILCAIALINDPLNILNVLAILLSVLGAAFVGMALGSAMDFLTKESSGYYIRAAVTGALVADFFVLLASGLYEIGAPAILLSAIGAGFGMFVAWMIRSEKKQDVSWLNFSQLFGGNPDRDAGTETTKRIIQAARGEITIDHIDQRQRVTADGLEFTVDVTIFNPGDMTTVYPEIRFRVAELINGRFQEKEIVSPKDWSVHLGSNYQTTVPFQWILDSTTKILLTPSHQISVRLHRNPWR